MYTVHTEVEWRCVPEVVMDQKGSLSLLIAKFLNGEYLYVGLCSGVYTTYVGTRIYITDMRILYTYLATEFIKKRLLVRYTLCNCSM